jgi:hypothetical protein
MNEVKDGLILMAMYCDDYTNDVLTSEKTLMA